MSERAFTETVVVRRKPLLTCEITVGKGGFTCEWSPNVPTRGTITPAELRRYQRLRDAVIDKASKELNLSIVVLE